MSVDFVTLTSKIMKKVYEQNLFATKFKHFVIIGKIEGKLSKNQNTI